MIPTPKEIQLIQFAHYFNSRPWLVALLLLVVAWDIAWKAISMWKAARNGHTAWYVCLLIFNTVGILPIIYVFFFSNKKAQ